MDSGAGDSGDVGRVSNVLSGVEILNSTTSSGASPQFLMY